MLASNAVAPPGGRSVLVICIKTIERVTAIAEDSQISFGINLWTVTPIIVDKMCPPIKLRGWANGLFIEPYIRTEDAPKDPIKNKLSFKTKYLLLMKPIMTMPKNAPRNVKKSSFLSINVSL